MKTEKIAVILFILGGPDSLDAVHPFLVNLFSDPDIIRVPDIFRMPLAKLIAARRAETARKIYAQIGGASPILPETRRQAAALQQELRGQGFLNLNCFTVMRYAPPRAEDAVLEISKFSPAHIVLLPLYPQYSTTTTRSSLKEWRKVSARAGLTAQTRIIGCYPGDEYFITAHAAQIRLAAPQYFGNEANRKALLLFSAHGLPQRIVDGGDPYPQQIERTAKAITKLLGLQREDWEISYQSRVGPLKWLQPSTEARLQAAGQEARPVVLVPISFVSEHSETLVELDIKFRELALQAGASEYIRVPALGAQRDFIHGLGEMVSAALSQNGKQILCGDPLAAQCCLMAEQLPIA